jgi:transcriptional regulator with XRE-family HTH domain
LTQSGSATPAPTTTDDRTEILARIEARLERIDQPAASVLKQAGLPLDLLDRLHTGKMALPRGQRLVKLADALGTSISYLIGLDPDVAPPEEWLQEDQASLGLLAVDENTLLQAYRRLDVASRAAALHVICRMAGPEQPPETGKKPKR